MAASGEPGSSIAIHRVLVRYIPLWYALFERRRILHSAFDMEHNDLRRRGIHLLVA